MTLILECYLGVGVFDTKPPSFPKVIHYFHLTKYYGTWKQEHLQADDDSICESGHYLSRRVMVKYVGGPRA